MIEIKIALGFGDVSVGDYSLVRKKDGKHIYGIQFNQLTKPVPIGESVDMKSNPSLVQVCLFFCNKESLSVLRKHLDTIEQQLEE